MPTLLVTGAAGFIGSNFVRWLADRDRATKIVALDKLTYAGNLGNIQDLIDQRRITFVKGDIGDRPLIEKIWDEHAIRQVVNFAGETHVDRSIIDPGPFIDANVRGVYVLLDVGRKKGLDRFVQIGTDEVYGTLPENNPAAKFREDMPLLPNSPYSASKAAGDCIVRSYFHTYKMPVLITRCSNNYGPYQFPEKLIPLFVTNLNEGKKVPLYGDGLNIRDWLFVDDHCEAVWTVLSKGTPGEVYNIGGNNEITNRKITETIIREMGKNWDQSVQYVKDRPGHDRRYALSTDKLMRETGWHAQMPFEAGLRATIDWYRGNAAWIARVKSGEYQNYYQRNYANRAT
jgi:dTDP-glucose 4,6-dehydratase